MICSLSQISRREQRGMNYIFCLTVDHQSNLYRRSFLMILGLLLVSATSFQANAQVAVGQTPLERYVQRGLDANPDLAAAADNAGFAHAQRSEVERAYLPSVELQARYTRSGGGRTIDFPLGDLLNQAYSTLNDLTNSDDFDPVDNQSFRLLRPREQETKLQLTQPVYHPSIIPGLRARRSLALAADADVDRVRADIVAQISNQYIGWMQSVEAVKIYQSALASLEEAVRVSRRLVSAGLATTDAVFRIEADYAQVEQDAAEAEVLRDLAAAALNTTLARNPDDSIEPMDIDELTRLIRRSEAIQSLAALTDRAVSVRPAIRQLDATVNAADAYLQLQRGSYLPFITLAADYGIQGSGYSLNNDARFRTASLVMQWTLFDGRRRSARVAQARLQKASIERQREGAANGIKLQVRQAVWNAELAERSIAVAERRLESAQSAFRITDRRFGEGLATQLDLLDARTALTDAQIGLSITRFQALRSWVDVTRAASL
jgi:outer membrane protein TolC